MADYKILNCIWLAMADLFAKEYNEIEIDFSDLWAPKEERVRSVIKQHLNYSIGLFKCRFLTNESGMCKMTMSFSNKKVCPSMSVHYAVLLKYGKSGFPFEVIPLYLYFISAFSSTFFPEYI